MNNILAIAPEEDAVIYNTIVERDSVENLDIINEYDGTTIYGTMPRNKWGWPWDKNYDSTYVVKVVFMNSVIYWHKWAAIPLANVEAQLFNENWDKKYHWEDLQTWNKRMIAGTNTPSNHAWPTAIDINPRKNPYRRDNKLVTDIPYRIVEIFKRYGFRWGGEYKSVKDPMHFEYLGEPVKNYIVKPVLRLKTPYMRGDSVKEAQTLLAFYGYDIIVDGVFGPHTDACTRSFQASKMLFVDGIIGRETWQMLLAKQPDRVLKMGTSGKDVLWVQRILNRVSKVKIAEDGIFGDKTLVAVKQFQKENNLTVDGIVGPNTWKKLRYKSNPRSR